MAARIDQDFVNTRGCCVGRTHNAETGSVPCRTSNPPFEGFSERVTDGSDDDRTVAYGRWLKRLRDNQSGAEGEDASTDQGPDDEVA